MNSGLWKTNSQQVRFNIDVSLVRAFIFYNLSQVYDFFLENPFAKQLLDVLPLSFHFFFHPATKSLKTKQLTVTQSFMCNSKERPSSTVPVSVVEVVSNGGVIQLVQKYKNASMVILLLFVPVFNDNYIL